MTGQTVIALAVGLAAAPAMGLAPAQRLTPSEITAIKPVVAGTGTSGLGGIRTRVLAGDPAAAGPYTIELTVPPHTRIASHTHRDDRVATVASGTWYFGYGEKADDASAKALPPGSFYTEPGGVAHFARTGATAVRLFIHGHGPSDTVYTEGKQAPAPKD